MADKAGRLTVTINAELAKRFTEHLDAIRGAWGEYIAYLEQKYPATNGKFELTCPHHRRIDALLKQTRHLPEPESEAASTCEEKG